MNAVPIDLTGLIVVTVAAAQFNIRHHIAELLEYLWTIPAHRAKWVQFSELEEKGKYLKFMNLVANDLIYLLDEGLNKLPEIKEIEVCRVAWLCVFSASHAHFGSYTDWCAQFSSLFLIIV